MTDEIRAKVRAVLPGIRKDLEDLVRIESVSADPARAGEVQRSAEAVAALFEAEGFDVKISSADGGAPAVIAHKAGPEGTPTVSRRSGSSATTCRSASSCSSRARRRSAPSR